MNAYRSPQTTERVAAENPERKFNAAPTTGDFVETLARLEQAMRRNPQAHADADKWLETADGNSDGAVYVGVLEQFAAAGENTQDTELTPEQTIVLEYMQYQAAYHEARAGLAGDDQAVAAGAAELATRMAARQQTAGERADKLNAPVASLVATANFLGQGAAGAEPGVLHDFIASLHDPQATPEQKTAARERLQQNTLRLRYEATGMGLLKRAMTFGEAQPQAQDLAAAGDQIVRPEMTGARAEAVKNAGENLRNLRSEIAIISAKREKQMWGTDMAWYSTSHKALYEQYQAASNDLFRLQNEELLNDPSMTNEQKIVEIAKYVATEGRKLDQEILKNYRENNTKFGKLMEKYAGASLPKKLAIGIGLSAVAGVLTGGYGTFAVSGSLMSMGFAGRRRKARAKGEQGQLDIDVNKLLDSLNFDSIEGEFDRSFQDATLYLSNSYVRKQFNERIERAQNQNLKTVLGSFGAAAALGVVAHHLPVLNGEHGLLHNNPPVDNFDYGTPIGDAANTANLAPLGDNVLELHTGLSDVFAQHNMGMYEAAQKAGFQISQGDLLRAAPQLYNHGLAYMMPDGLPGIPTPGQMPQATIDILRYFATNH